MTLRGANKGTIQTNLSDDQLKKLFGVKDLNDILKIKPNTNLPRWQVKKEGEDKKKIAKKETMGKKYKKVKDTKKKQKKTIDDILKSIS